MGRVLVNGKGFSEGFRVVGARRQPGKSFFVAEMLGGGSCTVQARVLGVG